MSNFFSKFLFINIQSHFVFDNPAFGQIPNPQYDIMGVDCNGAVNNRKGQMMKPPRFTTHVRLDTKFEGSKRKAFLRVKDMDCMAGCPGRVTFLRQLRRKNSYKELGSFAFDGKWPIQK